MSIKEIFSEIHHVIDQQGFAVITGVSGAGKSWLIANINRDILLIDKGRSELLGHSTGFNARDKWNVRTTEYNIVAIDEAQLLSHDELTEIAKLCIETKKALIVVTQLYKHIPSHAFQEVLDKNHLKSLHVELTTFDNMVYAPIGVTYQTIGL